MTSHRDIEWDKLGLWGMDISMVNCPLLPSWQLWTPIPFHRSSRSQVGGVESTQMTQLLSGSSSKSLFRNVWFVELSQGTISFPEKMLGGVKRHRNSDRTSNFKVIFWVCCRVKHGVNTENFWNRESGSNLQHQNTQSDARLFHHVLSQNHDCCHNNETLA